jgi:hypothetical protein
MMNAFEVDAYHQGRSDYWHGVKRSYNDPALQKAWQAGWNYSVDKEIWRF